jgi:hypothetical protein
MTPGSSKSTSQPPQFSADDWRLATLVHSAIAGASLAATVQLAAAQDLSNWLLAASVLFALALPASVSSVVMLLYYQARATFWLGEAVTKHRLWSGISSFLALLAQLACFGGVLMLFWHLSWIAGVAFLSTSLVAVVTSMALGRSR